PLRPLPAPRVRAECRQVPCWLRPSGLPSCPDRSPDRPPASLDPEARLHIGRAPGASNALLQRGGFTRAALCRERRLQAVPTAPEVLLPKGTLFGRALTALANFAPSLIASGGWFFATSASVRAKCQITTVSGTSVGGLGSARMSSQRPNGISTIAGVTMKKSS